MAKKKEKAAFYMTARLYKGNDSFLARVPVAMTTIPELPKILLLGNYAYQLVSTQPLTYQNVLAAKVRKV